ncbi:hypothetical protein ColLi_12903 [Colletotrichum liriopes]|uniref:Uncharacterized protein n=1 Tax=Colletotrichum liriopes TaxID=708192 RepID=A0AA37GZ84_9PEZI|nr:hypothetical protein ColLi_12903 [Colletotrichum liriopes]
MKRKRNGEDSTEACRSPRRRVKEEPFQESKSVRERARPYLLAVGKMHVDVLETMWSVGRNRRVEPAHVQELKDAFMKGGLERSAPENRIAVLCSAEEVRRIRQNMGQGGDGDGDGDDDPSDGEASFLHWAGVNNSKAEVMAGQHRLCALREYVKATGALESDAWWTCELYDKADLNIKLRINRRDPSLPDNHGQIWTQLVSIASDAAESTTRNQATVDHKLVEALRLGGEKSFPTRRLVTLWNHKRWRTLTTRWCQTRLGLETFNISTFEWMASLRIDDYWFATLEAALETLQALPIDETQDLGQDDWNRLAAALQGGSAGDRATAAKGRTQEAVEAAFYAGDGSNGSHRRATGLLETMDDAAYRKVCRAVWTLPHLTFVDLKRFLRSKRPEMETAVRVLHHVIGWIHRESAVDLENVNPKSKSKPQLLHHLQTALDGLRSSRGLADGYPADTALRLQQRVLDFARRSADAFRPPEVQTLLKDNTTSVDDAAYGKRFDHVVWARLLCIVRQVTDPGNDAYVLRPHWETANASEGGVYRAQVSTLVAAFCAKLFKLSGQSVGRNNPTLLALQQSVEKVLAVSGSNPQAALSGERTTAYDDANDVDDNDSTPPPPGQPQQPKSLDPADVGPHRQHKRPRTVKPAAATRHVSGTPRAPASFCQMTTTTGLPPTPATPTSQSPAAAGGGYTTDNGAFHNGHHPC